MRFLTVRVRGTARIVPIDPSTQLQKSNERTIERIEISSPFFINRGVMMLSPIKLRTTYPITTARATFHPDSRYAMSAGGMSAIRKPNAGIKLQKKKSIPQVMGKSTPRERQAELYLPLPA
jgi:hypothetical protein